MFEFWCASNYYIKVEKYVFFKFKLLLMFNDWLKVGACGTNVFWIFDCLKMAILHLKKAIGPILLVGCVVGTGIKQVYMTNMIVTSCVHYALEHINCRYY